MIGTLQKSETPTIARGTQGADIGARPIRCSSEFCYRLSHLRIDLDFPKAYIALSRSRLGHCANQTRSFHRAEPSQPRIRKNCGDPATGDTQTFDPDFESIFADMK